LKLFVVPNFYRIHQLAIPLLFNHQNIFVLLFQLK